MLNRFSRVGIERARDVWSLTVRRTPQAQGLRVAGEQAADLVLDSAAAEESV